MDLMESVEIRTMKYDDIDDHIGDMVNLQLKL